MLDFKAKNSPMYLCIFPLKLLNFSSTKRKKNLNSRLTECVIGIFYDNNSCDIEPNIHNNERCNNDGYNAGLKQINLNDYFDT